MTRTTNRDIDRLRALAATGVCRAASARAMGRSAAWVDWWAKREHIEFCKFALPVARYGVDDYAIMRLQKTMQQVRACHE